MQQFDAVRDRYVESLEDENETLRERIRQLEEQLGMRNVVPLLFGLTPNEGRVLGALLERDQMTKIQILDALYSHRAPEDEPEIKIVDVFVCKARRKLKPFGIQIFTKWGAGYYLDKDSKAKIREYLATEAAA